MSASGLVHDDTLLFDGTNYDVWKIRMLNYFRVMDPNIEIFLDMDFFLPMDYQNLSLEDEKNLYLNSLVSKVFLHVVSYVVTDSIMPFRNSHEL